MSRDWTPRECLLAEQNLNGKTWLDVSKSMTIVLNGKETPMCPPDYCYFLEHFNYLKRVGYDAVYPLYKQYGFECFEVVSEIEFCLAKYIEEQEITEQWICDWFDGKLDEDFYYATYNNELFVEKAEELKQKIKETPSLSHQFEAFWKQIQELAKEEFEADTGRDWEEADKYEYEDYIYIARQKLTDQKFPNMTI